MQQHFTDLDSVGRHRATGLHKLGARYPIPLKTNAGDNGRIGAHLDNGNPEILLNSISRYYKFLPCEQTADFPRRRTSEDALGMIRPKAARTRLDPLSYESLRQQILRRDGWRCQSCGTMSKLEVHHKQFRSRSGDDSEENLITLCAACRAVAHHPETKLMGREPGGRSVRLPPNEGFD